MLGEWTLKRGLAHWPPPIIRRPGGDLADAPGPRHGVGGLGATRASRPSIAGVRLVRPLLGWRKAELAALVASARIRPVDDPSNRDPRHDRVRIARMAQAGRLGDPERLAASAAWLNEAERRSTGRSPRWTDTRVTRDGASLVVDPSGVPRELQRRLLLGPAFAELGAPHPRGPELPARSTRCARAEPPTLAGLKLEGGATWRLRPAPPRRK